MTVKLGTVDFYQAMADELNNDPVWHQKGAGISMTMVYKYEAPIEGQFYCVFDDGKVTEVRDATAEDLENAQFVISGSSDVWRGLFEDKINPTVAMTRGQLRVRGKMSQLLKNMSAFQHVIAAMKRVDFE
ncbi:SCP2 sterol-binding domain-containing protein [Pseudonocardia sp. ICBG1142]|uniref:SCP2 sterol-binding domain-containing protein n=1 Tax=Pseudonocardia sp. ICBG1142 TaxID=2846760 RepID=UPI001CF6A910|nr:SCP2 sterol-binding domain-containing protein [Pseudonocardia sp. ICBG1142]